MEGSAPNAPPNAEVEVVTDDLISTAEQDSVRIVADAKAEIQQTILKSERELQVLASQTQAMLDLLQAREQDQRLSRREPGRPVEFPASARHVLSTLMRESRAELAALSEVEPLPLSARFNLPTVVTVSSVRERENLAARLKRLSAVYRRAIAVVAAVLVLIAAPIGWWWSVQRMVDAEPPESGAVATAGGISAPVEVDLAVRRPVWIRVGVDGQSEPGRLFHTGETRRITAAREVSIRAGDAGAVLISINGGPGAALGRDGQVMTRHVRPTATPAFASSAGRAGNDASQPGDRSRAAATKADSKLEETSTSSSAPEPPRATPPAADGSPSTEASGVVVGNAPGAVRSELTAAAQRWFEAYYTGDRLRMAAASSPDVTITDQRGSHERLPAGLAGVERTFVEASVQVFGADALLTAKMLERRGTVAGPAAETVAFVSLMWTRRDGEWKLTQVRIVSAAALEKMVHGRW